MTDDEAQGASRPRGLLTLSPPPLPQVALLPMVAMPSALSTRYYSLSPEALK
jgi:hypothetical protein